MGIRFIASVMMTRPFVSLAATNPMKRSVPYQLNLVSRAIFKKAEPKRSESKPKRKKKGEEINKDIFVISKAQAREESNRKKLKIFDYEMDLFNNRVYDLSNKSFKIDSILYE